MDRDWRLDPGGRRRRMPTENSLSAPRPGDVPVRRAWLGSMAWLSCATHLVFSFLRKDLIVWLKKCRQNIGIPKRRYDDLFLLKY